MYKKDDSNGINSVRKNESENSEHEFLNFKEPQNRFQGSNSARLCSLAGRYDDPIPTQFLALKDYLKIPAQEKGGGQKVQGGGVTEIGRQHV
jgi:hypothetical protein